MKTRVLKKAEKALYGVGIKTREVINGIAEIKPTSQVLGELAAKLHAGEINAEKLSIILNDVGSKSRADILAGIITNWHLFTKSMSDFEDANGSMAHEAQKELESWQGKLNVLQNNWSAFVANFVDTRWIKTGLDGLSGLVNVLDSAPGKIAVTVAGFVALQGAMRSIKDIPAIQNIGAAFTGLLRSKILGLSF